MEPDCLLTSLQLTANGPFLSQANPLYSLPCFAEALPSIPTSFKRCLTFGFSSQHLDAFIIFPMHATCPTCLIQFYFIVTMIFGE
jgi:hypothetical protein